MSDVVADLHVHTTASDGTLSLEEAIALAAERELSAIAITDHDRVHPDLSQPVSSVDGLTVIRGIELKVVREGDAHIDLLAYGVRETAALRRLLDGLQQDRLDRARRMQECLEDRLDLELTLDIGPGIGRPHIARAVAEHPRIEMTVQDVFDELIGDGRPCHVSRKVPTLEEGLAVLREAAPLLAVAHPLRYSDLEGALAVAREVGAIERWYPYDDPVDDTPVRRVIESADLLPTGGSDAHEATIGRAGLDDRAYDDVRLALGLEA